MSATALFLFASALVVAAGSPGPSIAALVARVLTNGFWDVLPFLAAMWLGEAIWLTMAVSGLAVLAQTFGALLIGIRVLGACYLLFLAWKMWTAPTGPADDRIPEPRRPLRMFLAGLTVTLGNPKIMIFYLALVPTIIDFGRIGLVSWAELALTMLGVLILVDCGWALAAARARRLLTNRKAVRIANRASATMMAGAAVIVATK